MIASDLSSPRTLTAIRPMFICTICAFFSSDLRAECAEHHSGDILVVLHHLNIAKALGAHDAQHRVRLSDSNLKIEPSARHKALSPLLGDAAVEIQTIFPSVQRQMRLIVPDGCLQPGNIPSGNVGRVGDNTLKFPQGAAWTLPGICLHRHYPGTQAVAANILTADFQRRVRILPQHHPDPGNLAGKG